MYLCSVLGKCCIWVCVAVCLFTGCSRRALHEAQTVVAQADSARAEGRMYGTEKADSIALAQAYHTLNNHPLSPYTLHLTPYTVHLSSYYVRACYHYGRLLREKDDPVAAMQCFINATHARSRDYHILGRVYSNMGSICHLAGEFPLSYDMFERSADCFLQGGDTLLYYYGLYRMAFEKAEMADSINTSSLLEEIYNSPYYSDLFSFTSLTSAQLYFQCQHYDSTISIVNKLQSSNYDVPYYGYALKARAYWHIGNTDSALYYAKYVLTLPYASEQDKYNILYIVAHCDSLLGNEDILEISAQRSDIETDVLIPKHNQWALAVQLLEQDLNKKPDLRWIYTLVGILLFTIASVSFVIMWRKRKQHKRLIQDIHIKEQMQTQLASQIDSLSDIQKFHQCQILADIEETCWLIRSCEDIKTQLCWNDYTKMCEMVNARLYGLANKLQAYHLSEKEIRLCILVLLKASTPQMVDMIPYAKSGLGKFKYTTARKLGTSTENLRSYILEMIN